MFEFIVCKTKYAKKTVSEFIVCEKDCMPKEQYVQIYSMWKKQYAKRVVQYVRIHSMWKTLHQKK